MYILSFFWFNLLLEVGQKFLTKFRCYFGRNDDFIKPFREFFATSLIIKLLTMSDPKNIPIFYSDSITIFIDLW